MRGALTIALLLALPPAGAHAQTARVADPAGDLPASFEQRTDVTGVSVAWDGRLTVSMTFAQRATTYDFALLVSSRALREHDPRAEDCEPSARERFEVAYDEEGVARLRVPGIEGSLASSDSDLGLAHATYVFDSPTLARVFASSNPFVCVAGDAGDGDHVFGAFEGKVLKLTSASADAAIRAELTRRYGAAFTDSPRTSVRCPARFITRRDGAVPATATCAFSFEYGARYRMGNAYVHLDHGVPQLDPLLTRSFPRSLRYCGITSFEGGWRDPPLQGAFLEAWGQRVSCATARRVAMRWRGKPRVLGFRCRYTTRGYEFAALRCTRGRRVVRFETGS